MISPESEGAYADTRTAEQAELDEAYRQKICQLLTERVQDVVGDLMTLVDEIDSYSADEGHEGDLEDAKWNLTNAKNSLLVVEEIIDAERTAAE